MKSEDTTKQIQNDYLQLLQSHLPDLQRGFEAENPDLYSHIVTYIKEKAGSRLVIPTPTKLVKPFDHSVRELLDDVWDFWEKNGDNLRAAIRNTSYLVTQVGDLSATGVGYIDACCRLGLYFDSICIVDPIFCAASTRKRKDRDHLDIASADFSLPQLLESIIVMHALAPLIQSDTECPIVIVAPPSHTLDERPEGLDPIMQNPYVSRILQDSLGQEGMTGDDWSALIGRESENRIIDRVSSHAAVQPILVQYEETSFNPVLATYRASFPHIEAYLNRQRVKQEYRNFVTMCLILSNTFDNIDTLELISSELRVDHTIPRHQWPLYTFKAKTCDEWWKSHGVREEQVIQSAIMSRKMDWMAAANVDDLKRIRELGLMEEIRKLHRLGRGSLRNATIDDFESLTKEIAENLTESMEAFQRDAHKTLDAQRRRWFLRVPGLAVGILAQFFPILSTFGFIAGSASLLGLIENYKRDIRERRELASGPIVNMFEIWERSKGTIKDNQDDGDD